MAASSSSEKAMEKQPTASAAAPAQTINKNSHVALSRELIERMRNMDWGERPRWKYDEEKIRRVSEIQRNMDVNDLMLYVMYEDGEEVMWDDDVWNVQQITQISEKQPPPQTQETNLAGKVDDEEPPSQA